MDAPKPLSTLKVATVVASLAVFEDAVALIDGLPARVEATEEMEEKKKLLTEGAIAFMSLKQGTRGAFLGAEEVRKEVEAIKANLDGFYVRLSSLKYRKNRLSSEVSSCERYECTASQLVASQGGPTIAVDSGSVDDDSQVARLAALDAELKERARMVSMVETARERKRRAEATIEADEATLAKLPRLMDALAKAAMPLQAALPELSWSPKLDSGDSALPRFLYLLWARTSACAQTDGFDGSSAVVVTSSSRAAIRVGKLERSAACVTIKYDDFCQLDFFEVSPLSVVVVEASCRGERDDHLFAELYQGDRGDSVSRLALHTALKHDTADLAALRQMGCVFDWAQRLAMVPRAVFDNAVDEARTARSICTRLARRIEARQALDTQLALLERRPPQISSRCTAKYDDAAGAALKAWTKLDIQPASLPEDPSFFVIMSFSASLQHQHHKATLKATIHIPADYPIRAPVFTLNAPSLAPRPHLKDIEMEINARYDSLVDLNDKDDLAYILSHQLAKLCKCFLTVLIPNERRDSAGRLRRGRDRRRRLIAAPELQYSLVHRLM